MKDEILTSLKVPTVVTPTLVYVQVVNCAIMESCADIYNHTEEIKDCMEENINSPTIHATPINSKTTTNTGTSDNVHDGLIDTTKSSWPQSPFPTDCIDQIYSEIYLLKSLVHILR